MISKNFCNVCRDKCKRTGMFKKRLNVRKSLKLELLQLFLFTRLSIKMQCLSHLPDGGIATFLNFLLTSQIYLSRWAISQEKHKKLVSCLTLKDRY